MASKTSELTALTGAGIATDDLFGVVDTSTTTTKKMTAAELEIAIRNLSVTARKVTLSGSTSITAATHGDRVCVLTGTGSAYTQTLPAASGSGACFTFVVGAVNTSNHLIKVANSSDTIKGSLNLLDNDSTAQTAYAASGTDDTITLNGTTTGGQIGDWVELIDVATNTWAVRGQCVVPAGSNIADPLSATV